MHAATPAERPVCGPETTDVTTAPNSFPCPTCGRQIAATMASGSRVQCPICHQIVVVPATAPPTQATGWQSPPRAPEKRTSGLAVAALVCGIVGMVTSCVPIVGLAGVILGIVALVQIRMEPERIGGTSSAIIGICVGIASLFVPIVIYFAFGSWISRTVCTDNLALIRSGLLQHAMANDSAYPPDFETLIAAGQVSEDAFLCLGGRLTSLDLTECYQYIDGQTTDDHPDNVLIYERESCHEGGSSVLFLDGRVEFIEPYSRVKELVAQTRARLEEEPTRD